MKFKIGEKVMVKRGFECKYYIDNDMRKLEGKIVTIETIAENGDIEIKEDYFNHYWTEECFKKIEFEVGDKVKINKQATIEDMTENHWNGCQLDTLGFIENYGDSNKIFIVKETYGKESIKVENSNFLINTNILELVERKQVKKMTVSEICEKLGYDVEIIKEEN